jgi:hypothetical protein
MRTVVLGLAIVLAGTGLASAQTPEPSPPAKLKLEPWVDPYGKVSLPDLPRYRDSVNVPGKAMDSYRLPARMPWFRGMVWEPLRGAVPSGGSAPRLEDTYPFRPRPTPAVDLQGVVKAILDEIRKK